MTYYGREMYRPTTELYHYGIIGQKWGVRRYQNYDGSYTQAGLKRYNKAKENYESAKATKEEAKAAYKSGTATKAEYKSASNAAKLAKNQQKTAYNKLVLDNKADKGKNLYANGKTIGYFSNGEKIGEATIAGIAASAAAGYAAAKGLSKISNASVAKLSTGVGIGVAAAGTAASSILAVRKLVNNNYLRAYYAHSSTKKS